jgi:hypothetical protein
MTFAVIEDDFKEPLSLCKVRLDQMRSPVAVFNALQIAIGRAVLNGPIAFVRLREINIVRIFRRVFVDDGVAFVVPALADQPGKHALRIVGIGNATFGRLAVERGDVVF